MQIQLYAFFSGFKSTVEVKEQKKSFTVLPCYKWNQVRFFGKYEVDGF